MSGDLKSRILIVDDEHEITEILSDLLSVEHDCQKVVRQKTRSRG